MAGDYRSVFARFQPDYVADDLSGEFRVQLGSYTEPFGLWWTARMTERPITYFSASPLMLAVWAALHGGLHGNPDELVVSKRYPFMAANLDGMTTTPRGHRCVIDAKHVARWTEAEIIRYTPAMTWQATCAGTDWWALAPIAGNKWEPPYYAEVDPIFQATMIARAKECWGFVERNEEPPEAETAVLPPKPQPRLRSLVVPAERDEVFGAMARKDNWLSEAFDHVRAIISTADASALHAAVEALANVTEEFASRRMDQSVRTALAGKTLDEV